MLLNAQDYHMLSPCTLLSCLCWQAEWWYDLSSDPSTGQQASVILLHTDQTFAVGSSLQTTLFVLTSEWGVLQECQLRGIPLNRTSSRKVQRAWKISMVFLGICTQFQLYTYKAAQACLHVSKHCDSVHNSRKNQLYNHYACESRPSHFHVYIVILVQHKI